MSFFLFWLLLVPLTQIKNQGEFIVIKSSNSPLVPLNVLQFCWSLFTLWSAKDHNVSLLDCIVVIDNFTIKFKCKILQNPCRNGSRGIIWSSNEIVSCPEWQSTIHFRKCFHSFSTIKPLSCSIEQWIQMLHLVAIGPVCHYLTMQPYTLQP